MIDVELTRALERCEVPSQGFHHADHLRVALVYLQESATIGAAIERMASTLRRVAASGDRRRSTRSRSPSSGCIRWRRPAPSCRTRPPTRSSPRIHACWTRT